MPPTARLCVTVNSEGTQSLFCIRLRHSFDQMSSCSAFSLSLSSRTRIAAFSYRSFRLLLSCCEEKRGPQRSLRLGQKTYAGNSARRRYGNFCLGIYMHLQRLHVISGIAGQVRWSCWDSLASFRNFFFSSFGSASPVNSFTFLISFLPALHQPI